MAEHILFLTGKLAEKSLRRVLQGLEPRPFSFEIRVLGVSVAALMTTTLIAKRLDTAGAADRVLLPGRCRGDLDALSGRFSCPFERGPDELKDLPAFFGTSGKPHDLSKTAVRIFAEIVDAPQMKVADCVRRAHQYKLDGADVIDIGCLPETPFPHLEEVVRTLKSEGYTVSVDSLAAEELLRGGEAGADFIFSLTEDSAWIADRIASIPVLISRQPSDEQSLYRLVERFTERGGAFYADAILDPIHYGFSASIVRYTRLRERFPTISIMMGIGNLSELTHTDSLGLNTLLMGIASELGVQAVLTTQVSLHCRTAVREIDLARRVLFAAHADNVPPRHISEGLMALHERHPFPYSDEEIRELAGSIRDPNFRIQVSSAGIHIYNRDGLHSATDPYDLFPLLNVGDDGAHAFYLGMELARAQIAWQLGKRYEQDEALQWGCVVERQEPDKTRSSEARTTLKARRYGRRESGDAPTPIPSNNHTSDDQ